MLVPLGHNECGHYNARSGHTEKKVHKQLGHTIQTGRDIDACLTEILFMIKTDTLQYQAGYRNISRQFL